MMTGADKQAYMYIKEVPIVEQGQRNKVTKLVSGKYSIATKADCG